MKIIIETGMYLNEMISNNNDNVGIYNVSFKDLFLNKDIALDKHQSLIKLLYNKDGVFLNSVFSFLYKLYLQKDSLYYLRLHNNLIKSFKHLLSLHKYKVIVYKKDIDFVRYLEIYGIDYEIPNEVDDIFDIINKHF